MFGFVPGQKCPGDGCENTLAFGRTLCAACARIKQQTDAAIALAACIGLKELAVYLENWARFERWLLEHGRDK